MRSAITVSLFVGLFTPAALWAQETKANPQTKASEITRRAVAEEPVLRNEIKAHYVLRQLELTPEQREMGESLLASIMAGPSPEPPLDRIRELMEKMREAQAAEDAAAEARAREDLKNLGQSLNKEHLFYEELERELPPDKVAMLKRVLDRLESNPSGAVRPIDLLYILRDLELTPEQAKKIDRLKLEFQERANEVTTTFDDNRRFALVKLMIEKLEAQLTPEQKSKFYERITLLRVDFVPEIAAFDASAAKKKRD